MAWPSPQRLLSEDRFVGFGLPWPWPCPDLTYSKPSLLAPPSQVALDLDALHAQRSLHRHVSVACIAVPGSGHLPASRLLPHGANIRCEGRGGTASCPVAFQGMEPYLAPELAIVAAGEDARSPATHTPACERPGVDFYGEVVGSWERGSGGRPGLGL